MPAEIRIANQKFSGNTTKIAFVNNGEKILFTSKGGRAIQIIGTEKGFVSKSSPKSEFRIETPQTGLIITCPNTDPRVLAVPNEI